MNRKHQVCTLCIAALMIIGEVQFASGRTWTSSSGDTIEARFIDFDGERILMLRADGKAFFMSPSSLSDKDQEFIEQLARFRRPGNPPDTVQIRGGRPIAGRVTPDGDNYLVEVSSGQKHVIPKSAAVGIHRGSDLLKSLRRKLGAANLLDDATLADLAETTSLYGLDLERSRILLHAYLLRRERIGENANELRKLAQWCADYSMSEEALCLKEAAKLEFPTLLDVSKGDGRQLAKLSARYRVLGLQKESDRAATEARTASPHDQAIEKLLSPLWEVKLIDARIVASYGEQLASGKITLRKRGRAFAKIKVQFQAVREADEPIDQLVERFATDLKRKRPRGGPLLAELLNVPDPPTRCALFDSRNVLLSTGEEEATSPVFTSQPPGMGSTLAGGSVSLNADFSETVRKYVRCEGLTALLLSPGHDVTLTLIFEVPIGTKNGALMFNDLPEIQVEF